MLLELSRCDVVIEAITFDGLAANISMCQLFDWSFDYGTTSDFKNPYTDETIHVILDPCHVQKLVRNTLASRGTIFDYMNKKVEWQHIVDLEKFSRENDFGLVHKLTKKHIEFKDRKMNVRISVQTLSKSVADSLEFLSRNNIENFSDVSGTVHFIRIFDTTFDIMNTTRARSDDEIYKSAINATNKIRIFTFLNEAKTYIASLKLPDGTKGELKPILESRNKAGFRGFIINIDSIIAMYEKYVDQLHWMRFLATYRLSQDHVEIFFGKIRSQNGFNDNPTCKQFISSYRKLLHNIDVLVSKSANCVVQCHSN